MKRAAYILSRFIEAMASALSRFVNAAFLCGSTHQTVSARAYVMSFSDDRWSIARDWIDAAFRILGPDHCKAAWDYEVDNALETLKRNGLIPK